MSSQRLSPPRSSLFVMAAAGLSIIMTGGCDIFSPTREFTIRVDSIAAPAVIGATDTLTVRFFGTIGLSYCHQLKGVEMQIGPAGMQIKFRGKYENHSCAQSARYLDHEETVPPPVQDSFVIEVLQPSGPPLEHVVRVE